MAAFHRGLGGPATASAGGGSGAAGGGVSTGVGRAGLSLTGIQAPAPQGAARLRTRKGHRPFLSESFNFATELLPELTT